MAEEFSPGDIVRWNWGSGTATGKVAKRCTSRVTRTIVTGTATTGEPAWLIEQEDGGEVLKSGRVLERP